MKKGTLFASTVAVLGLLSSIAALANPLRRSYVWVEGIYSPVGIKIWVEVPDGLKSQELKNFCEESALEEIQRHPELDLQKVFVIGQKKGSLFNGLPTAGEMKFSKDSGAWRSTTFTDNRATIFAKLPL